jgi:hypothetical protein
MQVTHVNDHVTHAVIGGAQTIDFGISNSAEFFNILSSTLYKDQKLAVIREGLCNAWDAHIEAGCTHLPIEVIVDDTKLVIKDFGRGIHRDDIGLIYGTYGNSTKKNDGKQTGGFGLGCKSPFAYTDHFEVISCNAGVKTIYNMSKSSAQVQGKPGIIPIASFPTEENGLQVTIHLKTPGDSIAFKNLIQRIARNGDMNVKLNGELLEKLEFDTSKANYMITSESNLVGISSHRIMVRYGNVIYPVEKAGEIGQGYEKVMQHLDDLRGYHQYNIVFQAPPNSISVQPSREGLSMQEHTIKTLNSLFNGFLSMLKKEFQGECHQYAENVVIEAVQQRRVADLLKRQAVLPAKESTFYPALINDLGTMAKRYMQQHYPAGADFRRKDITFRLNQMVQASLLDRGLVQSFLREMQELDDKLLLSKTRTSWLQKRVIAPILVKMMKAGIDHHRLFALDSDDFNAPDTWRRSATQPLVRADAISPPGLLGCLPYLRNMVVVTHKLSNLNERVGRHDTYKSMGGYGGYLLYNTSLKQVDKDKALAFFKGLGMTVIDLTQRQSWEPEPVVNTAPRKPPKVGLPVLSCIQDEKTGHVDTNWSKLEDAKRITAPEFVVQLSIRKDTMSDRFEPFNDKDVLNILKLYGDKGGIVHNSTLHAKWIKQGAKDFRAYVEEQLAGVMMNSPRIAEYMRFNRHVVLDNSPWYSSNSNYQLVSLVYRTKELRDLFGLVNNLTETEQMQVNLYHRILHLDRHRLSVKMQDCVKHFKSVKLDPKNQAMLDKIARNPLIEIIDVEKLRDTFKPDQIQTPAAQTALKVLLTVLSH